VKTAVRGFPDTAAAGVMVKTLSLLTAIIHHILQKNYISNKCWSFEIYFHPGKKRIKIYIKILTSTTLLIIRNAFK